MEVTKFTRFPIKNTLVITLVLILTLALTSASFGEVSTSDPLWDWKYDAIERLSLAFGESTVSNTRPMSRLEMADIVLRLAAKAEDEDDYHRVLLKRLEEDLKDEIESINNRSTRDLKIKPLRWVRVKAVHSDEPFQLENDYGFKAGDVSIRGEASTSGTWGSVGYELRPQYNLFRDDEDDDEFDLHSGYLVLWLKNLEVKVGKDAMWWGPGRHGAWLMTNNAPAFELIKVSNAVTAVPPGILGYLGDTKFTIFLGRLSEQKIAYNDKGVMVEEKKEPLLAGLRLDFSPGKYLELGVSQTVQFIDRGGRGYSLGYLKDVFFSSWESNEEEAESGAVANRITSIDVAVNIDGDHDFMRFSHLKGMKLYFEQGGETMDEGTPPRLSNPAYLYGLYLDTGKTDLRVEYATNYETDTNWYDHYQFQKGFRNEDFILGHHMGGRRRDLFITLSHPLTDNVVASLLFDRETRNTSGPNYTKDIFGLSVNTFLKSGGKAGLTYEYRDEDNPDNVNHVWMVEGVYRF